MGKLGGRRAVTDTEVVAPSGMIALGDNFHIGPDKKIVAGGSMLLRSENVFTTDSDRITKAWQRMALRHEGRANIAYCDGHLETPKNAKLFRDTSDEALVRWNRDRLPHRRTW
jgi:prepilin-type processing-associated H-X9-DG protein